MKAGRLSDRIRIDAPVPGVDGIVAPLHDWAPLWECFADISFGSSREFFSQNREGGAALVRIVIRMPPPSVNVTIACRAVDVARGVVYAIDQVGFNDDRTMLTLACVAGANDG